MKKTQFKYGGITLDKINSTDNLVPKEAIEVDLPTGDKKALAIALKDNLSTLLVGETGTGKTSTVKQLAYLRQQPYVRVNMTGFTTPDELIGSKSVKDGATYYENGIITDAMQRGAILVIDEVNATTPDCLFILHGLLDEDRRITLPNGDVINPHPDFRVFATCNPDYEGTKSMNKAFIDRFPIIIFVDVLTPKKEQELLVKRTGILPEVAEQLITIATMARKDYAENKISTYISTRTLINTAKLINSGLEPKQAYQTAITRKAQNVEEQKILTEFYLAVMKQANDEENLDTPYITTKREFNEILRDRERYEQQMIEAIEGKRIIESDLENLRLNLDSHKTALESSEKENGEFRVKLEKLEQEILTYKRLDEIINKVSQAKESATA